MKQRLLSVLLILCLLMGTIPQLVPTASAATYSGTCGDNLTWTLDTETGILSISGTGEMTNWSSSSDTPWYNYCSDIRTVEIDPGVTSIGDYAFYCHHSLTNVTIPKSVIYIGYYAFAYSYALTDVYYADTETAWNEIDVWPNNDPISSAAMHYEFSPAYSGVCGENLTWTFDVYTGELSISGAGQMQNWTNEGAPWYGFCTKIRTVEVGAGVTSIGDYAFYDCHGLTNVVVPNGVNYIGDGAFYNCRRLVNMTIPYGVTFIGDSAFYHCYELYNVEIPNSVVSIGAHAFEECSRLTSVTIPDSIISIGEKAFVWCSSLASVTIGDGVISIGRGAFSLCSSLISVTIPDSVRSIEAYAFENCYALNSVTIGKSLTSIDTKAFSCCDNLQSFVVSEENQCFANDSIGALYNKDGTVLILCPNGYSGNYTIPNGVTSIGDNAFSNCAGLTDVIIPEGVTSIGDNAFSKCIGLTDVIIPEGVTSVGDEAFAYCEGLTSVTMPDSLTSIGDLAFFCCTGLTSMTIPAGVTSIGNGAFVGCTALQNFIVDEANQHIATDAYGVLYNKDAMILISCPAGYSGNYIIPDGMTSIGYGAFYFCSKLTGVTIPDSMTSIGDGAFAGCSGLTNVAIPDGVTTIGESAFSSCTGLISVTIPDSVITIGEHAFYDCSGLISVTIPGSVVTFGDYAFYSCDGLISVTISDGVTSIGDYAFCSCDHLSKVTIADSVTSIGGYAFDRCSKLTDIYYTGTEEMWNEVSIGENNDPLNNATIHYEFAPDPSGTIYSGTCGENLTWALDTITGILRISGTGEMTNWLISDDNFSIAPWYDYRESIRAIVVEPGVTSIGDYAFVTCESLVSATIPGSVTSIGNYAFCWSTLSRVTIGNGVTSIGDWAFSLCPNLTSLTIPDSVTKIGDSAFNLCGLTSVTIGNGVTSIGDWAFNYCANLTSLTIPNSVISIGNSAFSRCSKLYSVTIGKGLASIGLAAFENCNSLQYFRVDAENPNFSTDEDGVLYNKDATVLVALPTGYSGGYTIPDGVIAIGDSAFYSCYRVGDLVISDSVTSIGDLAFYYCSGLSRVAIPASVTSIGNAAFKSCKNLRNIYIFNSSCEIYDNVDTLGNASIYGYADSTAEAYAQKNGKTFYPLCYCEDLLSNYTNNYTEDRVEATCTEDGSRRLVCTECGYIYTCIIPATGEHNYQRTIELEPTCSQEGLATYVCADCGETKSEVISVLDHSYDTGVIVTPATCSSAGVCVYTCTACGNTREESIPVADDAHNYEVTYRTEPTCEWTGGVIYVCTGCGDEKTEILPMVEHSYDEGVILDPATCASKGVCKYTCTVCGHTKLESTPLTEHSYDDGMIITHPGCVTEGIRVYTCTVCGGTKVESIPAAGHRYLLFCNNGEDHIVKCIICHDSYNEPHRFVDGKCVCGAKKPIVDEEVKIYHSLNLASDIAINYAVRATDLAGYESYYMECVMPIYIGNELIGTEVVTLQPVPQGDYYYFTLTGMTALEMNNMVDATLLMKKGNAHYASNTDSYSVATYAYAQLNNEAMPITLRTLCANLLRYGTKAQLWKGYRTDALADGAMTEEHKALLGDLESVPFGNNSQILTDVENPVVTWVGKTMSLDSKITVRFVVNTTNYTGDLKDLSLRISFVNVNGETENITLTNCVVYNAERNYYAFDFDGLLSAELRCVLNAAVYEGDTQLSPTMVYSVDTYGTSTTGDLRALVQGMIAYGDSAKDFFAN